MPKDVKITCDGCGRDLTITGNCVDYRLALVVENIPADTHYPVTAMMIYPPINRNCYFCGLSCLEGWLTKRAVDAAPRDEKSDNNQGLRN